MPSSILNQTENELIPPCYSEIHKNYRMPKKYSNQILMLLF